MARVKRKHQVVIVAKNVVAIDQAGPFIEFYYEYPHKIVGIEFKNTTEAMENLRRYHHMTAHQRDTVLFDEIVSFKFRSYRR